MHFGLVGVRSGLEFVDLADRETGHTGNHISGKIFLKHTFCSFYHVTFFTPPFTPQLSILLVNLINHIRMPETVPNFV